MGLVFIAAMPLAVWMARPFQTVPQAVPQEPTGTNTALFVTGTLIFVALAIGMAVLVLWAVRTGRAWVIQGILLVAVAAALTVALGNPAVYLSRFIDPDLAWGLAFAAGILATWLLWRSRKPWARNTLAFVVGAAVAALTGATLGATPLLFLLVAIAAYDLVAVRKTKHMQKLAHAASRFRLPVAFELRTGPGKARPPGDASAQHATASRQTAPPHKGDAPMAAPDGVVVFRATPSERRASAGEGATQTGRHERGPTWAAHEPYPNTREPDAGGPDPTVSDPPEPRPRAPPKARRRAMQGSSLLVGLGDLVFPVSLVVAAADPRMDWGWPVAAATAVGIMAAFVFLMRAAFRGEAQPGLPLLNGGAILGFLAGLLAGTGSLVFW